jgi:hypothetical protein
MAYVEGTVNFTASPPVIYISVFQTGFRKTPLGVPQEIVE